MTIWSKVVKQIEHDLGGPVLPHTPSPTSENAAILNNAGQNIVPVKRAEWHGHGVHLDTSQPIVSVPTRPTEPATPSELPVAPNLGVACNCSIKLVFHDDPADSSPMFEGFVTTLPAHQEIHVSNACGSEPPTPAETLALADELTAAGTPDETLVGEELRAALLDGIADQLTTALLSSTGYAFEYARPAAPSFAEMVASINAATDRDRTAYLPTRIKLTQSQIDSIPKVGPRSGTELGVMSTMFGYPVDLVDTVEKSTPYLMGAYGVPHVITLSPTDMAPAEVAEFRAAFEQAYGSQRLTADEVYAATRAANEKVEAEWLGNPPTVGFHEPPQPGWLARVIRRLFG
jgi:hypothetical protein